MLTLIPEQERQIDYRFEFSVVGQDARQFVESAVNSEMAEAFRPTAKEEEKWGHTASAPPNLEANGLDFREAGSTPGEVQAPAQSSSFGKPAVKGSDQNKLILYCPYSEQAKGIARIRFTALENFSESLPLTRDRMAAANQAVIFLFWHVKPGDERDEKTGRSPTEERIKDFMARIAEINFLPAHFRPACILCGFETEESQETQLDEWAKKQKATVWTSYEPDDGEDTIMESVQKLCEKMVERSSDEKRNSDQIGGSEKEKVESEGEGNQKSSCCAVL